MADQAKRRSRGVLGWMFGWMLPAPAHTEERNWSPTTQLRQFLSDIHAMKAYASGQGLAIPDDVADDVARLAQLDPSFYHSESVSPVPVPLPAPATAEPTTAAPTSPTPPAAPAPGAPRFNWADPVLQKGLADAIKLHAKFCKIVAPATPDSIRYTTPPRTVREFYHRQRILFYLILIAVLSLGAFLGLTVWDACRDQLQPEARVVVMAVDVAEERLAGFESAQADKSLSDPERRRMLRTAVASLKTLDMTARELKSSLRAPDGAGEAILPPWPFTESPKNDNDNKSIPPASPRAPDDANDKKLTPDLSDPATGPELIRKAHDWLKQVRSAAALAPGAHPFWVILLLQFKVLAAGMLGAAFYTLYTAHGYVVSRTFDRAYTTLYVVRFVLGAVAGYILASFGQVLLGPGASATASGMLSLSLTQVALALAGGYSADSVNALLKRFAETTATLVRGSDKAQVLADAADQTAKDRQKVSDDRQRAIAKLQDALTQTATPAATPADTAAATAAALKKAIAELNKP